ncbi:GrpB family protein [Glycocaulis sp.]|uniref:GrpB family protein n=1 Tax=Glycocaulis sp. TaxID=1969725 RepID=UPI003D1CC9AA
MKKDPIDVIAYEPRWVEEGLSHAEAVAAALGPLALRVDHVGSTAVPGLAAKDVIDIQALVMRLEDEGIIAAMLGAGYRFRDSNTYDPPHPESPPALGEDDWRKLYFREAKGARRVHIHIRRNGAAAARNALLLRDFLRDDVPSRRDYGEFKMALAVKTRKDRDAYQAIKRPFISIALRSAESWAELTRWVPGAPDAYWRSAE